MLRRILTAIATFSIVETIGVHPWKSAGAIAGSMLLLGAGGVATGVIPPFTPTTVLPQPSIQFPQSNSFGQVNAGFTIPAGAMNLPSTATASWGIYHEVMIPPPSGGHLQWLMGSNNTTSRSVVINPAQGSPATVAINQAAASSGGVSQPWWLAQVGLSPTSGSALSYSAGTGNNPGFWTTQATTACSGPGAREPTIGLLAKVVGVAPASTIVDPGFLCGSDPSTGLGAAISAANVPGLGVTQSTGGVGGATPTTCANNTPVTGQYTVTAATAVAHGVQRGQNFRLEDFTPSGYNQTYLALPGTANTTLVGTWTGTCPAAVSAEGFVALGTPGGIGAATPALNPNGILLSSGLNTGTGVQIKASQRVCGMFGEFGSDSKFPGAQFAKYTDITGADVPGSPAVSPWLNMNVGDFTGYTVAGTQGGLGTFSASVTNALSALTVTNAVYNSGEAPGQQLQNQTGFVTFTVSGAHGLSVGDTFVIAGVVTSSTPPITNVFNNTFQVLAGSTGSTIVASLASNASIASNPVPSAYASGGTIGSGNSLNVTTTPTSSILINAGTTLTGTGMTPSGATIVSQTSGATGGIGVYALSQNIATTTPATLTGVMSPIPALHVTAINQHTITSWTYSAGTGFVTFTLPTSPGFVVGSEFTVTGGGGVSGKTYVAVAGTSGTTVVGNPLSAPVGFPQANNPGSSGSGGTMGVVITPGMMLMGATGYAVVSPYGAFASTGAGGVGTYGLTATQASFNMGTTGSSISGTTLTVAGATGGMQQVVVGQTITGAGVAANSVVVGYLTGAGGNGTYLLSQSSTISGVQLTNSGAIFSSGSPGYLYAAAGYFYSPAPVASSTVGGVTVHTAAAIGDFTNTLGTAQNNVGVPISLLTGWSGMIANVGMYQGPVPMTATGNPDPTEWNKLCTKFDGTNGVDPTSWAATEGGSWLSLFKGNDPGIWGDHALAEVTGSVSAGTLTIASTQAGTSTSLSSGDVVSGAGLCNRTTINNCPTITGGSGSSYTISDATVSASSEPISIGNFQPLAPVTPQGNITASISGNVLTVSALPSSGSFGAAFTGCLTNTAGSCTLSGSTPPTTLFVTGVTGTILGGECINDGGLNIPTNYPLCIVGGTLPNLSVATSNFSFRNAAGIAAETMYATFSSIGVGQNVMGAGITTPVQIIDVLTQTPCAITGFPGCGTYALSSSANGTIASESMAMSAVAPGGAIAPGATLTVQNPGYGSIYPTSAIGSSTGNMKFNGDYNASLGLPQHIQALIASSPAMPPAPVSGCSACGWNNISSESISGGKWSGTVVNIPNGGPYYAFFRASNGTSYATLPNSVCVGWNIAAYGEGNAIGQLAIPSANNNQTYYQDTNKCGQVVGFQTANNGGNNTANLSYVPGPAISGTWSFSSPAQTVADRYSTIGQSSSTIGDGSSWLLQNAATISGAPIGLNNQTKNGTGFQSMFYDNIAQAQTIGIGDGSTKVFASGLGYGAEPNTSAGGSATVLTGSISGTTLTITAGFPTTGAWKWINPGQHVTCGSCAAGTIITGAPSLGGATGTYTVSPSQTVSSTSITITHNNLAFNTAYGTGATLTGTVSSNTLTVTAVQAGVIAPLETISDGTHAATINACLTGCDLLGINQGGSTWSLSTSTLTGTSFAVAPPGGALYASASPQPGQIPVDFGNGTVGTTPLIKYGTFQVLDNGSVVCQDSNTFAYNVLVGNCTGAGVTGWVNYFTGAFAINFTTAPTSGHFLNAKWVNLQSGDNTLSHEEIGWTGFDSPTGGILASVASKTGGVNAYLQGQQGAAGWPLANLGYARALNWAFGTSLASLHNGMTNAPMLTTGQWRGEGPIAFQGLFSYQGELDLEQLDQDQVTKSEFTGSIASSGGATGVLTLTSAATGPMWEGEVLECNPYSATCGFPQGTEIVSLCTVALCGSASPQAIGVSGSTYALSSTFANLPTSFSSAPMHNAMYYPGGGGYVGPYNDLTMQAGSGGAGNYAVETGGGISGALRYGHRVGIEMGAVLAGDLTKGSTPTLNRTLPSPNPCSTNTAAITTPCFDLGNGAVAWPASHPATWTGKTITISGGLSANARPFVPGMALSCSGCNSNLVALAVSLPPTQSTVTGAGQIGQTFTITASGSIGGSGSGTVTGGCLGTSGVGSNCIDFNITINTGGTYGTTASLNTCGVNNLVGVNTNLPTAAPYIYPNGACLPTGVGALVRGFRIGGNQTMDTPLSNGAGLGSVYDFGPDPDPENMVVNQNQAFTCNIVAATWVQCVHGPIYASGLFSSRGQWSSGSTFASYGDPYAATGFIGAIVAPMGGQSFPFTAGSGYPNGHYVTGAVCPNQVPAGGVNFTAVPAIGFDISSGAIVNAYPSVLGNGMLSACAFPLSFSGTGTLTLTSGLNGTFKLTAAPTGGTIAPGEVLTIGTQQVTIKPIQGNISNTGVSTAQTYQVSCAVTCVTATGAAFTVGPQTGSGGAIAVVPLLWSTGVTTPEGVGGIGTNDSDTNLMGTLLYDNSGVVGNPLQHMFDLPAGGQESPGLPVRPFGMRRGPAVGG